MKTQTDNILPTYQIFGQVLRINYDEVQTTKDDMQGTTHTSYEYTTAVSDPKATRAMLIEAIIASKHSLGEELSLINNQSGKPAEYSAYKAFRTQAKALADGYLAISVAVQQKADTECTALLTQTAVETEAYLAEVARVQAEQDAAQKIIDDAEAAKQAEADRLTAALAAQVAAEKALADKAAFDKAVADAVAAQLAPVEAVV